MKQMPLSGVNQISLKLCSEMYESANISSGKKKQLKNKSEAREGTPDHWWIIITFIAFISIYFLITKSSMHRKKRFNNNASPTHQISALELKMSLLIKIICLYLYEPFVKKKKSISCHCCFWLLWFWWRGKQSYLIQCSGTIMENIRELNLQ